MRNLILSCVLCWNTVGCGADFTPSSRVDKLRLLAVSADAPFAQPGEQVVLQPLLAAPEDSPVSWAFATCSRPDASSVEGCLRALEGPFRDFDPEQAKLQLAVDPQADHSGAAVLGVILVACPGAIESGTTQGVPVVCRGVAGERMALDTFEVGMKRISIRERDRNGNPTIDALTWDGEAWPEDELKSATACDDGGHDIDACPAALRHRIGIETSAAEQGVDERGAPFEEQQIVQVYASHGSFAYEVRIASDADNRWVAQHSPHHVSEEELATLWFVVRDDRGGVGWQRRRVRVR